MALTLQRNGAVEIRRQIRLAEREIESHESEIEDLEAEIGEHQGQIEDLEQELESLRGELGEGENIPVIILRSDPAWHKAIYPSPAICPECSKPIGRFFQNLMAFPGDDKTHAGEAYQYQCGCGAMGEWFRAGDPFEYVLAITRHKESHRMERMAVAS